MRSLYLDKEDTLFCGNEATELFCGINEEDIELTEEDIEEEDNEESEFDGLDA